MYKDFEVIVSELSATVSEKGFGTILILDHEKDREYKIITENNLEDLGKTSTAYKIATRLLQQNPAPQEIAVAGAVSGEDSSVLTDKIGELIGKDWFWLVCTDNSPGTIKAIAERIATTDRFYAATFNEVENTDEGGTFVASFIEELEFNNTFLMYHDKEDAYPAESLTVPLSYNVGGKTGKFKVLQGVVAADITLDNVKYLHENGAFTYLDKKGVLQTTEGIATDGSYIDTVIGNMWIKARIEERLANLALANDKIPYTNKGIGMMVGVVEEVLAQATGQGIIAEDEGVGMYEISYVKREDVPTSDIAKRDYSYIQFVYTLAGAIHTGTLNAKPTYAAIVL